MLPPSLAALQQQLQNTPTPATARQVIAEYCAFISPASFRQELWTLTTALLISDQPEATTGQQRQDALFFFEFTAVLIQAVYALHNYEAT